MVPTFQFYFVKPFNMTQRGLASSPVMQVLWWGAQVLREDTGIGDTGPGEQVLGQGTGTQRETLGSAFQHACQMSSPLSHD